MLRNCWRTPVSSITTLHEPPSWCRSRATKQPNVSSSATNTMGCISGKTYYAYRACRFYTSRPDHYVQTGRRLRVIFVLSSRKGNRGELQQQTRASAAALSPNEHPKRTDRSNKSFCTGMTYTWCITTDRGGRGRQDSQDDHARHVARRSSALPNGRPKAQ